ncbi:MAG: DUF5678 domain-containing protein [Nitrospirota bacterium]
MSPSSLREQSSLVSRASTTIEESAFPEPDVLPFLSAIRRSIETEQLSPARSLLDAAPIRILSDPVVTQLRAVLAPPVVTRVQRRDIDRRTEYEWLRTEGSKYRGRWVALNGDHLVATAETLRELRQQLLAMRLAQPPLIHRVE